MAPLLQSSKIFRRSPTRVFSSVYRVPLNTGAVIAILSLQSLLFYANAGLHGSYSEGKRITLQETAVPKIAGPYYRAPGKFIDSENDTRWFGPEIDSRVLCPNTAHQFNKAGFFDIIYTREEAEMWPSSRPGKTWWYRRQEWRFATADTPWRTDTVHVTLISEISWTDIDAANTVTGFPWTGFEEHWRESETIKSKADVTGYQQYEHAGKKYLAPKYYKHGTLSYVCATEGRRYNLKILTHTEGHFTSPEFRPKFNKLSRREKGTSKETADWYDCIPLK